MNFNVFGEYIVQHFSNTFPELLRSKESFMCHGRDVIFVEIQDYEMIFN